MTTTYVFYGEDRRHIEKGATAYHGFRLDLTKSVDLGAIKAKATAMAAAPQSDLRIRIVPPALFTYTPAADVNTKRPPLSASHRSRALATAAA